MVFLSCVSMRDIEGPIKPATDSVDEPQQGDPPTVLLNLTMIS